ncbi:energy-coupling factor transporter transmembrane component T family protein [Anaerosphaera multitolerans]|uniref:Energy-coupling factor transporter transmembrane protein EcfT n=1 Tax=Anaerosphaera multitolerans TaxID=2487351 RepID=A0A437S524_9FIRM|nr:energy-coupling factor transporter transmembrane component T [Anaerosphaera multitolerans]RVU54111.1 energy-coupling factor transporter transmembrane protein EcfT [Anaerosphaera multitolerans]
MLKDISVGQYYPGNSIVHRLDPRLKIIAVLMYIMTLFFIKSYIPYLFIFIYLTLVVKISGIPYSIVLRGMRPLRWIILITFIINLLFIPGEVLFKFGFISISEEGLDTAIKMAIRLLLIVSGTSLLTLTTSPIEITDGIEALLKPLKVIKVPAHEIAMMMTIALRFIPTLVEETDKIMKAQIARGADFESGNILNRAKNLVPLLVPLFINSLRRADELSTAMESRCYRGGDGRTKFKELALEKKDYVAFVLNMVFFAVVILWRYI